MLKKLQLAVIGAAMLAGSLAVAAPARAHDIVVYSHHHYGMRVAARQCSMDGGVWTSRGCVYSGETTYRYNRFSTPGTVYYRNSYRTPGTVYYNNGYSGNNYYNNGYWRNGGWNRD